MLPEILVAKRRFLATVERAAAIARFEKVISRMPPVRSLRAALIHTSSLALIAEIKRRSPSKGALADIPDPAALAREYVAAGARAVSVLTDREHFGGSLNDLTAVRNELSVPVLRKDFIIDPYQVFEARAAGADVILLIAAALTDAELRSLYALAGDIGLEVLLEVHNESELRRVLPLAPAILGVNNRDLDTFATDLAVAERMRNQIPITTVCVAESGVHTREDMRRMEAAGYDGVLIGEGIVTAANRTARIHELLGVHAHAN